MARGGIYTADLAAKERGIKPEEKLAEQERTEKKSIALDVAAV